jgi:hypothetical protein
VSKIFITDENSLLKRRCMGVKRLILDKSALRQAYEKT